MWPIAATPPDMQAGLGSAGVRIGARHADWDELDNCRAGLLMLSHGRLARQCAVRYLPRLPCGTVQDIVLHTDPRPCARACPCLVYATRESGSPDLATAGRTLRAPCTGLACTPFAWVSLHCPQPAVLAPSPEHRLPSRDSTLLTSPRVHPTLESLWEGNPQ